MAITRAPARRAACADIWPIMPSPITTTRSPGWILVIRTPDRDTLATWYIDAAARSTSGATLFASFASTTRYPSRSVLSMQPVARVGSK